MKMFQEFSLVSQLVLAKDKVNIVGQNLMTNEDIGYVVTDIEKKHDGSISKKLRNIPNTIKFRVLY